MNRGRQFSTRGPPPPPPPSAAADGPRETKWCGKPRRHVQLGEQTFDTMITGHLTGEQLMAYQEYFRSEEITHLLNTARQQHRAVPDILPSAKFESTDRQLKYRREPSPPPKYDRDGMKINTRDKVVKEALEKERHEMVELAAGSIKGYMPPSNYTRPRKTQEKLYVPVKDYPDINFVGFLIGPRGSTLKQLQEDSGALLQIRGKGSVKEGKSTDDNEAVHTTLNDELHVLISSDSQHKITKAVMLVNEIIDKLIHSPEGKNDIKRNQLLQLARLNGTYVEKKPHNAENHERRQQQNSYAASYVCQICNGRGHLTRDCKQGQRPGQRKDDEDEYDPGERMPRKRPRNDASPPPPPPPGPPSQAHTGGHGYGRNQYSDHPGVRNDPRAHGAPHHLSRPPPPPPPPSS
ncbi:Branchpoint-bridging protein [Candida viswanathii]|uniref:Branchpoint-bridging protein n=1 Tax=Candida viswanathii TaxID=5486 RepID=A0A367Y1G9_9ASCO|nr:Branchpoint-bridging protein [Candida viswanathii]